MNKREFKDKVYTELSKAVKALSNPHRLEIIDLLAQGPFSVEQIANNTALTVANTSQHLQHLKNAKLVKIARDGNFINYSLTNEDVYKALICLRELGRTYNAEVEKVVYDFRNGQNMKAIDAEALVFMLENDEVIVIDVRPEEEFNRGHIHKALSIPIEKLDDSLNKLPKHKMIIAYCRGPFCVFADEAVTILNQNGFNALRLEEGFPEWALKGFPINSF